MYIQSLLHHNDEWKFSLPCSVKSGHNILFSYCFHRILPSAVTNETAFITSIHHEPCLHQTNTCSEDCEVILVYYFRFLLSLFVAIPFDNEDRCERSPQCS